MEKTHIWEGRVIYSTDGKIADLQEEKITVFATNWKAAQDLIVKRVHEKHKDQKQRATKMSGQAKSYYDNRKYFCVIITMEPILQQSEVFVL